MFQGRPYLWARLVYQFIKLCAEVYTFTVSHDFQMHGFARPKTSEVKAIRFTRQVDVGTPFQMAQFLLGYTHRLEDVLHPMCQAILTPFKVTTNNLEKVL
jgi:hypothetical protein